MTTEPESSDEPSFGEATTWSPVGPGQWEGTVPPAWMQGRTSFGGIAAAVGLRALCDVEEDGRPPRTVHTSFFAPVRAEPARVTARIIRRGRFVTHARAEIEQGDTMTTQVVATFAHDRPSKVQVEPDRVPDRPAPETLAELPYIEGVSPRFVRKFAFRWTDGGMPFSGTTEARLGGWCRHRTHPGPNRHAAVLGLIDAWPSPFVSMLTRPAPASSVTWTTNFYTVPAAIEPHAWWWYGSAAVAAADGYGGMRGSLYTPQGALCATVEQLVAVFDAPS